MNCVLCFYSGEKIWIFETIKNIATQLNSHWISEDITPLICPSVRVSSALQRLICNVQEKNVLTDIVKKVSKKEASCFDIGELRFTNNYLTITMYFRQF